MVRIAITGGIAEGKSTVLGYLREQGHETASADLVAREVFADSQVQMQIGQLADLHPPLDSAVLREKLGASVELRRAVNRIMHPEIVRRMDESAADFFEIPLVIETCRYLDFDEVWVVTCGAVEQRRRLLERYGDPVQVDGILSAQIDSRAKIAFGDRVFRTNQPQETVRQLVSEATASIFRS